MGMYSRAPEEHVAALSELLWTLTEEWSSMSEFLVAFSMWPSRKDTEPSQNPFSS
jgi:hypothetical protein